MEANLDYFRPPKQSVGDKKPFSMLFYFSKLLARHRRDTDFSV